MKTLYLAGRISGDPDYKAKFRAAEEFVSGLGGYAVVNPAVLPERGFSYSAYIRMSMAMLYECDIVCFLPDWHESIGAGLEYDMATVLGKEIIFYDDDLHNKP